MSPNPWKNGRLGVSGSSVVCKPCVDAFIADVSFRLTGVFNQPQNKRCLSHGPVSPLTWLLFIFVRFDSDPTHTCVSGNTAGKFSCACLWDLETSQLRPTEAVIGT